MQRQRGELVPIGDALSGTGGAVKGVPTVMDGAKSHVKGRFWDRPSPDYARTVVRC